MRRAARPGQPRQAAGVALDLVALRLEPVGVGRDRAGRINQLGVGHGAERAGNPRAASPAGIDRNTPAGQRCSFGDHVRDRAAITGRSTSGEVQRAGFDLRPGGRQELRNRRREKTTSHQTRNRPIVAASPSRSEPFVSRKARGR
jgi:hypothetical protein